MHEFMPKLVGEVKRHVRRTLAPFGKYIVVRDVAHGERKTEGGIIMPGSAKTGDDVPNEAMVLAVGPECVKVKVGDRICYPMHGGRSFSTDGRRIMSEDDLYGRIEDVEATDE